jgi:hypothetical protein
MTDHAIPDWLKPGVQHAKKNRERLEDAASNWMRLYEKRTELTELDCLGIIYLELENGKRPELIGRVKVWFDKLRSLRENHEMWLYHPGAGIREKKPASEETIKP